MSKKENAKRKNATQKATKKAVKRVVTTREITDQAARSQSLASDALRFIAAQSSNIEALRATSEEVTGKLKYALTKLKKSAAALQEEWEGGNPEPMINSVEVIIAERDGLLVEIVAQFHDLELAHKEINNLKVEAAMIRAQAHKAATAPPKWLMRMVRNHPVGLPPEAMHKAMTRVISWAADAVKAEAIAASMMAKEAAGEDPILSLPDKAPVTVDDMTQEELDEQVHEALAADAAAINNQGPEAQREFLASQGA